MKKLLILLALFGNIGLVNAENINNKEDDTPRQKLEFFVENTTHSAFARFDQGDWKYLGRISDDRIASIPHQYFIPLSERAKITSYSLGSN